MKHTFTTLKATITLLLIAVFTTAFAQAPFNGPSDAITAPPATAAAVQQVLCNGSQIQIKTTATAGYTYQWYKKNSSGTMVLVQQGASSTYTETSTSAGYYTYQLVVLNSNGCTSTSSDPFNIFVLPPLTAGITATNGATVCASGQTNSILTATPASDANYTYTYQWTRNGTAIAGATASTYTVTETTAGSITYGVTVAYALNGNCSSTATQSITVIAVPTKPVIVTGP